MTRDKKTALYNIFFLSKFTNTDILNPTPPLCISLSDVQFRVVLGAEEDTPQACHNWYHNLLLPIDSYLQDWMWRCLGDSRYPPNKTYQSRQLTPDQFVVLSGKASGVFSYV